MTCETQAPTSYPRLWRTKARDKLGRKTMQEQDIAKHDEQLSTVQKAVSTVREYPGSSTAVGALAFYTALRAGIELFHLTRRSFLRQLLLDLCPALDAAGYLYWVDFGSLLGIHRDGDLIPYDNDIDLVILKPTSWEEVVAGLQKQLGQKYSVKVVTPSESPSTQFVRVYCPLGMADIFGACERGGEHLHIDFGHGDSGDIRRKLVLPPRKHIFRGQEVCVPANVEGTLRARYGPTWRTPRYMDKGSDTVEAAKLYARIFRALSWLGIRL